MPSSRSSSQEIKEIPAAAKKTWGVLWKITGIGIALIVIGIFIGVMGFLNFVFLPFQCIYTSQNIPLPPSLSGKSISLEQDEYVATGRDPDYGCLTEFKNVNNEIVNNDTINNSSIGVNYYSKQNRAVNRLSAGTVFTLTKLLAVTKHGIYTVDSGPGPLYFLILEDTAGKKYEIATVELSSDYYNSDAFLGYIQNGQKQMLTPDYFDTYLKTLGKQ